MRWGLGWSWMATRIEMTGMSRSVIPQCGSCLVVKLSLECKWSLRWKAGKLAPKCKMLSVSVKAWCTNSGWVERSRKQTMRVQVRNFKAFWVSHGFNRWLTNPLQSAINVTLVWGVSPFHFNLWVLVLIQSLVLLYMWVCEYYWLA